VRAQLLADPIHAAAAGRLQPIAFALPLACILVSFANHPHHPQRLFHVGDNQGFPLTPNASYVCGYDKVLYEIDQPGDIDVVFVPSTDPRFRMVALNIKGDLANEYGARKSIADRTLSFSAANQTAQSIYFAVTVEDTMTGKQFECDPQVENMPPD
jgi:hypothetical protein